MAEDALDTDHESIKQGSRWKLTLIEKNEKGKKTKCTSSGLVFKLRLTTGGENFREKNEKMIGMEKMTR